MGDTRGRSESQKEGDDKMKRVLMLTGDAGEELCWSRAFMGALERTAVAA